MKNTSFLYGNIRVMPPGRDVIMFRGTLERAKWYVERGLGRFEQEDLLRLTFEPGGLGHAEDPYFIQEFRNCCVVCGSEEMLSHHHIVPECYRKYFPRESEEEGTWMYDVLLLCKPCHKRYEKRAWERKVEIAKTYQVPISGAESLDMEKLRAIKAAAALCRYSHRMPEEKKVQLAGHVQAVFGRQLEPQEYLEIWKSLEAERQYVPMGKLISEKVADLDEFAIGWREHFLLVMQPACLPEGWVADRRIYVFVKEA